MERLLEPLVESTSTAVFQTARYVLGLMARAYPLTFQVFLRRKMGEGYCQPIMLVAGVAYMLMFSVMFGTWLTIFSGPGKDPAKAFAAIVFYALAFAVMCVVHSWRHWLRFWTDRFIRHHSQDDGVPVVGHLLFRKLKDWQVKMFVEPVIVFAIGILAGKTIGWGFGGYFVIGGIALFTRETAMHGVWRETFLRYIDHDIEAKDTAYILKNHVVNPAPAPGAGWQRVIEESFHANKGAVTFEEMASRLDPTLRDFMAGKARAKPPTTAESASESAREPRDSAEAPSPPPNA